MHRFTGQQGGFVSLTTVVPEGSTLGKNIVHADQSKSPFDQIRYYLGSFAAGFYGERKIGHEDHSGCRYDFGMMENLAQKGETLTRGLFKASQLIQEGFQSASNINSSTSDHDFNDITLQLYSQGTI